MDSIRSHQINLAASGIIGTTFTFWAWNISECLRCLGSQNIKQHASMVLAGKLPGTA